ncbi:hypothetical protein D3C87_1770470 [compost metagenome]
MVKAGDFFFLAITRYKDIEMNRIGCQVKPVCSGRLLQLRFLLATLDDNLDFHIVRPSGLLIYNLN